MVVICDATWRFFSELESTDIGSSLEETGSGFLEQNIKLKRAENIYVFWPLRIDFRETTGFLFSFCCFFISSSLRRLSSSSRLSFALNECTLIITVVCSNKSGSRLCREIPTESGFLHSWKMHSLRAEILVKLKSAGQLIFGKKILKKE
jgi:hypothetical protein